MNVPTKLFPLVFTPAFFLALSIPASAEAPEAAVAEKPSSLHADAEIDPTAYVLQGYSVHVGVGGDHFRVDLGAFAMAVPEFMHGNEAFDVSFNGFGLKFEYFPFQEYSGAFVGVGGGVAQALVERKGTELAARRTQYSAGGHIGYRIDIYRGFYATPWIGLDYTFNAEDVTLGGETYENNPWTIFPAIHVGYRFR